MWLRDSLMLMGKGLALLHSALLRGPPELTSVGLQPARLPTALILILTALLGM